MNVKLPFCFLVCLIFVNSLLKGQSVILAVNSTSKTVAQLNATDGSVINANFINLSSLNPGTMKGIIQVQNKFWISDQTVNVIYICNSDGTYSSTIPASTGLSNIRGLNVVNNEVWVTVAGAANGATANSIRRFDFAGNPIGSFDTIGSPFDVLDNGSGSVHVTSFNSEGIQTMSYSGTISGNLVQSGILSGIQQMNKTQDGNYIVSVFSNNSGSGNNAGVYLISSANGNIINKWTVGGARGAIQAGNGNYLYTTGNGVYSLDPSTGSSTQLVAGGYQYLKLINTGTLKTTDVKKENNYFSVYPNPTPGIFYIKSEEKINSATLYSSTGQIVKTYKNLENEEIKIDISDLPANTYLLKTTTKSGQKTSKIIKK
jgi:hypothetical protein